MGGRLGKILKELNIGLQTARSILGRSVSLNSKITHSQFLVLRNYISNLTQKVSAPKPASPPSEYLNGVPEEVYAKSVQVKKSKKARIKHKFGNLVPKASKAKKGSAKYSDPYKLQMMKNQLAKKYEGYEYGLSDW
jgi:hypothetical protein